MVAIVFISEGDDNNSSTKHRCLMISSELNKRGIDSQVLCRNYIRYGIPNLNGQIEQWKAALSLKPDLIVLHRSCSVIDAYMVNRVCKKSKIIYDFDDALFEIKSIGKHISYSHIDDIIQKSNAVFAGSHYLLNYAEKFNKNTLLIPSPVDANLFCSIGNKQYSDKVTIGWLGGGSKYQLRYLKLLKAPLKYLADKYSIRLRIVSSQCREVVDEFSDLGCEVDFGLDYWAPLEEIPRHISDFDIGVMPLTDEPYSRGKCAMKALEYMSMNIPVVASAVGENAFVVKHGYNGFLASNTQEWIQCLEILVKSEALRQSLGQNGRKMIEENYSLDAVTSKVIDEIDNWI